MPLEPAAKRKLSVVTTLFNSARYIDSFYERITQQARLITSDYELIFVDDGSPDNSLKLALNLVVSDANVHVIELSRNFGHHKAMMTGLEMATGDMVFLIDVDLEEPPELLSIFHREMKASSWDVVYGYQNNRKGNWFERESGRLAWWMIDTLLPIKVPRNHSTVRLMSRDYTRALVLHKERNTAIGGLWVLTGFRQSGIQFEKGFRGESSYTFAKRIHTMFESITAFSETPLYAIYYLGAFIFGLSLITTLYLIVRRISGTFLEGWVSVMVSLWLLGGLTVFSIGVVGLYVARIFVETKNRPYTIVRKTYSYPLNGGNDGN